jgi:hypothetical protein
MMEDCFLPKQQPISAKRGFLASLCGVPYIFSHGGNDGLFCHLSKCSSRVIMRTWNLHYMTRRSIISCGNNNQSMKNGVLDER